MEIIKENEAMFSQLEQGDIFIYDGDVYMKMEKLWHYTDGGKYMRNAVSLSNGFTELFDDDDMVETAYAKLMIE